MPLSSARIARPSDGLGPAPSVPSLDTAEDRLAPLAIALADADDRSAVRLLSAAIATGTLGVADVPALLGVLRALTQSQRAAVRRTTLRTVVVAAGALLAVSAAEWTAWYRLTPWPDTTNHLLLELMRRVWRGVPVDDWTDARIAHVAALLTAVPPDVPDELRRWITKEWVDGEDSWRWQLAASFPPPLMDRLATSMHDQAPHLAAARAQTQPFRTLGDVAPFVGLNWRTQSPATIRSTITRCLFLPAVSADVHAQIAHLAAACLSEAGDDRVLLLRQFVLQQPDLAGCNRALQSVQPQPALADHFQRDIPIHVGLCHAVLAAPDWPGNDLAAQALQGGALLVSRTLWSRVVTRAFQRGATSRAWTKALRSWWACREAVGPWPEVTADLLEAMLASPDADLREWATTQILPHLVPASPAPGAVSATLLISQARPPR